MLPENSIDATPNAKRVAVAKGFRQQRSGQILVADGPQKSADGKGSDRRRPAIAGRRIGPAMDHRMTDFNSGRPPIDQHAPNLAFQRWQECARSLNVQGIIEL